MIRKLLVLTGLLAIPESGRSDERVDVVTRADVEQSIANDPATHRDQCDAYRSWARWINGDPDIPPGDRIALQEMLDSWTVTDFEYDDWRLSTEARLYVIGRFHADCTSPSDHSAQPSDPGKG